MMLVVALAAACCRWPPAALGAAAMAAMVGGPILGGWLRRKRGDAGVIEGSVLGGVVSYLAMFVFVSLAVAVDARSLGQASWPVVLVFIVLGLGLFGVVGMVMGLLVGSVSQVGVAVMRKRERRRRAASDREWHEKAARSDS